MEIICEYCNSEINDNSNNCPYCLKEITKEFSDITDLNNLIDSILSQEIVKQLVSSTDKGNSTIFICLIFLIGLIASFFPIVLSFFVR